VIARWKGIFEKYALCHQTLKNPIKTQTIKASNKLVFILETIPSMVANSVDGEISPMVLGYNHNRALTKRPHSIPQEQSSNIITKLTNFQSESRRQTWFQMFDDDPSIETFHSNVPLQQFLQTPAHNEEDNCKEVVTR
jgi:hypothetical protein